MEPIEKSRQKGDLRLYSGNGDDIKVPGRRGKGMKKGNGDSVLVWSSEAGRICPGCGKAAASCNCRKSGPRPAGDGIVRVRRESKGRGGKTVTVVTGAPGDDAALKALAGELKRRCGSGGTVKDGAIEIQGDFCDLVVNELARRGFNAKRAGG
jgi:translation initiation factor 1